MVLEWEKRGLSIRQSLAHSFGGRRRTEDFYFHRQLQITTPILYYCVRGNTPRGETTQQVSFCIHLAIQLHPEQLVLVT
jgi:hypothetical protein